MPKTTVSSWDTTANNNTDLNSINIGEGWASADINNAIREMMSQVRAWYGGLLPYEGLSADDTQAAADANKTLGVDASGGAKTITLPTAASIGGRVYTVIKIDSSANTVTVDGDSAETINGSANLVLRSQYAHATVVSNGTNWVVVSHRDYETTKTASTSADLEFTGLVAGCYEFDIDIIFSEEANLVAIPGNAGGYSSTDCYYYGLQSTYSAGTSAAAGTQYYTVSATGWRCAIGNATYATNGLLRLFPVPQDSAAKSSWHTNYRYSAGTYYTDDSGGGTWDDTATKIKFAPSAGTFTGTIKMRKVS